jgi:hypothetical protein
MRKSLALSPCKAKLVSMIETTKRVIWFRILPSGLHRSHQGAVRIKHDEELSTNIGKKEPLTPTSVDNKGATATAELTGPTKQSKHCCAKHAHVSRT